MKYLRYNRQSKWHIFLTGFWGLVFCAFSIHMVLQAASIDEDVDKARQKKAFDSYSTVSQGEKDFDRLHPEVKLNFLYTPWPKVLQEIAEQTSSKLVADRVPAGRLTRRDKRSYSKTEALRVLNRELEPKGFRLVAKGKYLDLVHLRSLRSHYLRPQLPKQGNDEKNRETNHNDRNTYHSSPDRRSTLSSNRQPRQIQEISNTLTTRPLQKKIRVRNPLENESHAESRGAKALLNNDHQKSFVFHARHRSTVNIAREIYKSLKSRSKFLEHGPGNLPSVEFYAPVEKNDSSTFDRRLDLIQNQPKKVLFTLGIDTTLDKLYVEAGTLSARMVQILLMTLDVRNTPEKTVRLVVTQGNARTIARRLNPIVVKMSSISTHRHSKILQASFQQQPKNRRGFSTQKQPPRQANTTNVLQQGEELLRIQGLKGVVIVSYVPGVGLVVTGNEEDVKIVIGLIRALDVRGQGLVPRIHLQPLRHVSSQAMTDLLNALYSELADMTQIGAQGQPMVRIVPVNIPNAVIVITSEQMLPDVLKIIADLDKPVDPTLEFEIFQLKSAIASQMVTKLEQFFQQQQQTGNQTQTTISIRFQAIADARTNTIIVQARPNDMAAISSFIQRVDDAGKESVNRVKFFKLKNAVASELAGVLNSAIQSVLNPAQLTGQAGQGQQGGFGQTGGGQSSQELREIRSSILEFMMKDGNAQRLVRSGILADIRVSSDPRTNAIIITAPESSMNLIEALINFLDQPSSLVADIKVFTLLNSDATAMVTLLQSLFPDQTQNQQQGNLGIQVVGAEDAGSGLIPLRFTADARTNSVIAIGGTEALVIVEAVILRLDNNDQRQRENKVIRLRNAPATDVANAVSQFLQQQRDLANLDPNAVSTVQLLEREVIVVAEPISNSLLISATPRYYNEISELIGQLDKAPAQVIIQALLVEVQLDNTDELGLELGFQDDLLFDRGITSDLVFGPTTTTTPPSGITTTSQELISQNLSPGFAFNNQPLGLNPSNTSAAAVGTQGLSNFGLGRTNADLGFGGLVLSAQSKSVSVLLRALAAKREVHVLSRPQIRTLDNQLAQIQVGQQVPIVSDVNINANGGAQPIVTQDDAGLILTVTPRISPEGMIVMEVIAEKSSFGGQGVPIFVDATTGNVTESPIKDITTAQATVSVPNGQTIVMGGMITKSDDTIARKVPLLGDIPLLGNAFRFDSTSTRRTELLIFLTPRIIRNDTDSEIIKQIEAERMHFIEEDAEAIHGPLYATPPEEVDFETDRKNFPNDRAPQAPMPSLEKTQSENFPNHSRDIETSQGYPSNRNDRRTSHLNRERIETVKSQSVQKSSFENVPRTVAKRRKLKIFDFFKRR